MVIEDFLQRLVKVIEEPRALRSLVRHLSPKEVTDCAEELLCHIDVHIADGCIEEADKLLRIVRRLANRSKEEKLIHKVIKKRLDWLEAQGKYLHCVHRLISMHNYFAHHLPEGNSASRCGEILMDIAIAYSHASKHERAIRAIDRALKIFHKNNDEYNIAAANFNRASILYDQSNFVQSTSTCIAILPSAEKYPDILANVFLQLANNLEAINMRARSCQFYGKAMSSYFKLGEIRKYTDIAHRLGWLMLKLEHFDIALKCLHTAFFMRMDTDTKKTTLRNHYLRAQLLRSLGMPNEARNNFLLSLIFAEGLKDSKSLSLCRHGFYQTRGELHLNLRSAMTATSISSTPGMTVVKVPGGFHNYKGEGVNLPDYTNRHKPHTMTIKEKRSLKNLINDLVFCSGALESIEVIYFRKQLQQIYDII